jgi:hypothetical protein
MLAQSSKPHEPVEEDEAYVLIGPNTVLKPSSPKPYRREDEGETMSSFQLPREKRGRRQNVNLMNLTSRSSISHLAQSTVEPPSELMSLDALPAVKNKSSRPGMLYQQSKSSKLVGEIPVP